MAEVHEDWSTHKISERLRVLLQRRTAALRERGTVRSMATAASRRAELEIFEPPPMTPRGPSRTRRAHLYSDLPPEDLLAVISAMEGPDEPHEPHDIEKAGRPRSPLDPPGDLLSAMARALELIEEEEESRARDRGEIAPPHSAREPRLHARPVTSHRPERPNPASGAEAFARLAELDLEITDLEQRISVVRRVLSRRAWAEGSARLQKLRAAFEAELPGGVEAQRFFDADEYVRANRPRLQIARSLAQKCGEAFPSRETDFMRVPRPMRELLFRKIQNLP